MGKFKKKLQIGNGIYDMLLGGLHSHNPPGIYEAKNGYAIIDIDVASMYPREIIENKVIPAHLWTLFLDLYTSIVDDRLVAKKAGEKVKADALKIVVNSIYGKMGSSDSWLYDPLCMYTVTINGQLKLLMLIEDCVEAGIEVFYANTDGITIKCKEDQVEQFNKICSDWEKQTGFELEHNHYKKMVIRDVNNYAVETIDGKFKEKGCFITHRSTQPLVNELKAAFDKPVVAESLHQYFFNQIPVENTIIAHQDILDFTMAQKVGGQFTVEYHHLVNNKLIIDKQQKTNRYYVSTTGGALYKRKESGLTSLCAGNTVKILNDFEENVPILKRDVDYNYYVSEVNKIIQKIEVKQLTLF